VNIVEEESAAVMDPGRDHDGSGPAPRANFLIHRAMWTSIHRLTARAADAHGGHLRTLRPRFVRSSARLGCPSVTAGDGSFPPALSRMWHGLELKALDSPIISLDLCQLAVGSTNVG